MWHSVAVRLARLAAVFGAGLAVAVAVAASGGAGPNVAPKSPGGCAPGTTTPSSGTTVASGTVTVAPAPPTPVTGVGKKLTPEQLRRSRDAIERSIRNPCTPSPLSRHRSKPRH